VPGKPSIAPDNARHMLPNDVPTNTRAEYVAMVEQMDRGVGEVLRALGRLNLANNTIVIFTNDNGGEWLSNSAPLFNRKSTVWEGGIRVPALIRWPGRIPAGKVSGQVGITMDLTASILAATGTRVTDDIGLEGVNLFPVIEGRAQPIERTVFWRSIVGNRLQRAVRRGDWKLVIDGNNTFVFDVRADPGERHDLTAKRQDVANELRSALADWERDIDAEAKKTSK